MVGFSHDYYGRQRFVKRGAGTRKQRVEAGMLQIMKQCCDP
jgi:hypothetical protein